MVSILIPSYNHARFLTACLESIQAQTIDDWEVILIDDGSKDESLAIAHAFAQDDPRIQVHVNLENLGTYGTQQRALELSRGGLIAIMNSDDFWAPEKLQVQVALMEEYPRAPLCNVLGWLADEDNEPQTDWDIHENWPMEEKQELLPYLLYENRILASGVLFRRVGLRFETSLRYSGDWIALLEQSRRGEVACSSKRLTFWRQHPEAAHHRSPQQVLEEIRVRMAIHKDEKRWFVPRIPAADIRLGLAMNAINIQALAALCGYGRLSRRMAAYALKVHPQKKAILKRCVASLLPSSVLRKRLWRGESLPIDASKIDAVQSLSIRHS